DPPPAHVSPPHSGPPRNGVAPPGPPPAAQHRDRAGPVCPGGADPYIDVALVADAPTLPARRILVDRHDLRRREDLPHLIAHRAEIVACHERRGEDRPQREVSAALVAGQFAVAHLEHVGIVPVIGPCVWMQLGLPIEDRQDVRPLGLNVPAGTPQVTDPAGPFPWPSASPLANREHDRAPRGVKRHGPLGVEGAWTHALCVAPVHLHIVDTPFGEAPGVAELVAETCRQVLAGLRAGVRVDAKAQTALMDAHCQECYPDRDLYQPY